MALVISSPGAYGLFSSRRLYDDGSVQPYGKAQTEAGQAVAVG